MLPVKGVRVRSLVRELRSRLLWDAVRKMRGKGSSRLRLAGQRVGAEAPSALPVPTALLSAAFVEMHLEAGPSACNSGYTFLCTSN